MRHTLSCRRVSNRFWGRIFRLVPLIVIGLVFIFSVVSAYGTTNYVSSASGNDANTGADWNNAWLTLTNAVAQSASGDTVVLSNGVYTLASELTIDKALTVIGFGDDPEDVSITPETATRIYLLTLTHADAIIENLTLRDSGRAIKLEGAGTVRGCIIRNCGYGRYIVAVDIVSGGLVENSVIRECAGGKIGGGVRISGAGTLRNCLVTNNIANHAYNIGENFGGGVYMSGSGGLIENCTIVRNMAGTQGGGVYVPNNAGTISNSIVMFNRAPQGMNLYGNPYVDNATILSPEFTRIGTTRAIDPQFVDFENGDYRLRPGSPAIDTGEDATWMSDATDLDGNPRLDGIVDVGAYEYTRGALEAGLHPAPRSGFQGVTEIVFTGAAEGTNTAGIVYTWDFNNDGTSDASGTDKAVVTNVYTTSGFKNVRLTIENSSNEQAELLFENAVKIGPATVCVDKGSNSDTFPYASWSAAASNMQDAVDAAVPGSVVKVGAGNYLLTETLLIQDDIVLESVSGYADTIVDGQNSVGCMLLDPFEDRVSGYLAAVVDGFTIRNGSGSDAGGVALPYGGTLRNSVVSNNLGTDASDKGGVLVASPEGLVENCRIIYNKGGRDGAGAGKIQSGGVVRNCVVYGNSTAGGSGNGVGGFLFNRGGLIENCTIVGNYSPNSTGTGGIYASVIGTVRNSIVYFNLCDTTGINDIRSTRFTSDSTDNITSVLVDDVTGSTADPDFVEDGSGYGETHIPGDYRLKKDSPAVDEGSFQTWMTGAFDLDGKSRIYGSSVDIGAYEWHPPVGTLIIIQ